MEDKGKRTQILEISFPGGRLVDGKIKADRDHYIQLDPKTGGATLRRRGGGGPGITIEPCECAIEGDGSCDQATTSDPNGDITDLWCVDSDCGFCVGGLTPEVGAVFNLKIKFATIS